MVTRTPVNMTARMACLLAMLVVAGCASSKVTNLRSDNRGAIPRPERVLVHDFAATPDDVGGDAAIGGHYEYRSQPLTAEEIEIGRKLGADVAAQLVDEIRSVGLNAQRAAGSGFVPRNGDLLIKGEFVEIDEGSKMKRMLIGFGAGASELKTHVEAYTVTEQGPVRLGEASVKTEGGKMPGMLVPVGVGAAAGRAATSAAVSGGIAVAKELGPESMRAAAKRTAEEIMKILKQGFVRRGWITPELAD